jgi:hypothetical protein
MEPEPDRPIVEFKEPAWCPRCCNPGPFDYHADTNTFVCTVCGATWTPEPERRP